MFQEKDVNAKYLNNGVVISPAIPAKGETAKVIYKGMLAQSGADKVYIRVGFGEEWKKATDYKMVRTQEGFAASIPVTIDNTMNFCFKDSAGHWDNNYGENYSFHVL